MAYSPILMRLQCGEHPEYTELRDSRWMEQGYGMISIYKSDWERIGGKNNTDAIDSTSFTLIDAVHYEKPDPSLVINTAAFIRRNIVLQELLATFHRFCKKMVCSCTFLAVTCV